MGDTWDLDELFLKIQGRQQYLWRAVDEDGDVIDILVQSRRDSRAAARFFRTLLTGQSRAPRRLITQSESWADELGRSVSFPEINDQTSAVVHPAYRRALGVLDR